MFIKKRFILKAVPVIVSFNVANLTFIGQHPTLARTQTPALFSPQLLSSLPTHFSLLILHLRCRCMVWELIDDQHFNQNKEWRPCKTALSMFIYSQTPCIQSITITVHHINEKNIHL